MIGRTGAVGCRCVIGLDAVLSAAPTEAARRTAVSKAAPHTRHAGWTFPVRQHLLGSDRGDAHIVVEPQVAAVVGEVRALLLQLGEVQAKAQVDGGAVITGPAEVVIAAR